MTILVDVLLFQLIRYIFYGIGHPTCHLLHSDNGQLRNSQIIFYGQLHLLN